MLEKASQFCQLAEQPCEHKSLGLALNIAGVSKIRSEDLRLWSTLEAISSTRVLNERSMTVEICVLCGWRFSNQFDTVLAAIQL